MQGWEGLLPAPGYKMPLAVRQLLVAVADVYDAEYELSDLADAFRSNQEFPRSMVARACSMLPPRLPVEVDAVDVAVARLKHFLQSKVHGVS
jgi:hypothetical protein